LPSGDLAKRRSRARSGPSERLAISAHYPRHERALSPGAGRRRVDSRSGRRLARPTSCGQNAGSPIRRASLRRHRYRTLLLGVLASIAAVVSACTGPPHDSSGSSPAGSPTSSPDAVAVRAIKQRRRHRFHDCRVGQRRLRAPAAGLGRRVPTLVQHPPNGSDGCRGTGRPRYVLPPARPGPVRGPAAVRLRRLPRQMAARKVAADDVHRRRSVPVGRDSADRRERAGCRAGRVRALDGAQPTATCLRGRTCLLAV
jgi:hypothetical protein